MNGDYLKFETDDGTFLFSVSGDCCSTSKFYDFYGVKNLLNNGKITEVKQVELNPDLEKDINKFDESIQVYGYQFTTVSERFGEMTSVFSFRNYSNGYYGGELDDIAGDQAVEPKVTEDVVEVK